MLLPQFLRGYVKQLLVCSNVYMPFKMSKDFHQFLLIFIFCCLAHYIECLEPSQTLHFKIQHENLPWQFCGTTGTLLPYLLRARKGQNSSQKQVNNSRKKHHRAANKQCGESRKQAVPSKPTSFCNLVGRSDPRLKYHGHWHPSHAQCRGSWNLF